MTDSSGDKDSQSIMREELVRLKQWFFDRKDRPGCTAQVIQVGMALTMADAARSSYTPADDERGLIASNAYNAALHECLQIVLDTDEQSECGDELVMIAEAIRALKNAPGPESAPLTPLSEEAKASRKPLPPEVLAGALQDTIHTDTGRTRPATAARVALSATCKHGTVGYCEPCALVDPREEGPTPRTDAWKGNPWELARQLERELAAATQRGDFWRKQAEEWDERAADEQIAREEAPVSASPPTGKYAVQYERRPNLDKRIALGDDYAGDAWVRWVAVGHTPYGRTNEEAPSSSTTPTTVEEDAARYRWLNKQHNFLIDFEGPEGNPMKRQVRLRCGPPLDSFIDARIEEEEAQRSATTPAPRMGPLLRNRDHLDPPRDE